MKSFRFPTRILALAIWSVSASLLTAQQAAPAPPSALTTPVTVDNLDPAVFTQWVDGVEKPIPGGKLGGPRLPESAIWTTPPHFMYPSLIYGDSKTPGVRHLRIGFKNAVAVGTVLAHGDSSLSVLKPGAAYPGDLSDDSQWIPAQRLDASRVTSDEPGVNDLVLWVLPPGTSTRALRFTHTSQISDRIYGGTFRGAYLLPQRMANLAPQAVATASSLPGHASRLIDGKDAQGGGLWENMPAKEADRPKTVAEDPEWVMLTWPTPVTLNGLASLGGGFSAADAQIYTGPESQHPSQATEDQWKTVQSVSGWVALFPGILPVNWIDFGGPVTTRAVRLRITAAFDPKQAGQQVNAPVNGKRVWLDELMALKAIDTGELKTALLPVVANKSHAPIAIHFNLPDDGFVTLVIEDSTGKRIRNLIADTPFPKGDNTVYWDGTDDLARDKDLPSHGIYSIPSEFVAPGTYQVRGLWHRKIDLNYEMSVYSPGNPPWPTQDTSGGWMTNHTPASCAIFIPAGQIGATPLNRPPAGQPLVMIGSPVSEGGSAISWVDLNGNKVAGRGWVGGAWTGASYLANDTGPRAIPGVYAYVASAFLGSVKYGTFGKIEIRLTKLTNAGDQPVLKPVYLMDPLDPTSKNTSPRSLNGLAVYNGLLVASQAEFNRLMVVDVNGAQVLGTPTVQDPRGVAFDSQGRLLVLSGTSLLRFTLGTSPATLPAPETLVTGFEDPKGITIDSSGQIYVSDQGNSNQVKIYSPDGKLVRTIGHAGAPQPGPYDPLHLNHPKGMAVDSNGRLWVTEDWFQPKRVSVWNADGTLWKAYYGPAQYGGGGALDPQNGSRFSYDGMEFKVDWDKGTWDLQRDYYQNNSGLKLAVRMAAPEATIYINGRRYMHDAFNSSPTSGSNGAFLFLDKGDVVVPVAAVGVATDWDVLKDPVFKTCWPAGLDPNGEPGKNQAVFVWSDLNGDGQVQPNEVKIWAGHAGGVTVAQDGSFLLANMGDTPPPNSHARPGHAVRLKPVSMTAQGVPVYDPAKAEILSDSQGPANDGGNQILLGTKGWTVLTTAPPPFSNFGLGGTKDGVAKWSYPSLWPGLHASHNSPAPEQPGELIGTTRLLGDQVTPRDSDAGPLFFINSNQGNIYVFTQDGLFVTQLFQDVRQGPLWEMPSAQRGMLLNNISLHDENFFPTVTQVPDGSIYLDSGAISALVKVSGLESINRIPPMTVAVSPEQLKLAQDFVTQREAARQASMGTGVLGVALQAQAPALDGNPSTWDDNSWALIDQRGVAAYFDSHSRPYNVQAAVTVAAGKLYAMWKTDDPKLLANSGTIDNAPFKTGGALDLMIGTDPKADPHRKDPVPGDLRLLVTQVNGKTKAVLYRAVVPGTPDKDKVPFAAPWHSITLDSVTDVSDQVQLVDDRTGDYEIAVPLTLLGLNPADGMKINGDVGILRGDGTQTTQRVYWNNKATAIVSDVPSEAMLMPSLWGIWEFHAK